MPDPRRYRPPVIGIFRPNYEKRTKPSGTASPPHCARRSTVVWMPPKLVAACTSRLARTSRCTAASSASSAETTPLGRSICRLASANEGSCGRHGQRTPLTAGVGSRAEDAVLVEWTADVERAQRAVLDQVAALPSPPPSTEAVIGRGTEWATALQDPDWADGDLLAVGSSAEGPLAGEWLGHRPGRLLKYLVTHRGRVTVVDATLYSRPENPPKLLGAAVSPETAAFVGGWADGLLTINQRPERLKRVVDAFRRGGGEGKPMFLQVALNWAPSEDAALHGAHEQWRYLALGSDVNWELRSPELFDGATRRVRPEDIRDSVLVSSDPGQHAAWLQAFVELGFEALYLHQIDRNQEMFMDAFATKVLPQLRA